jgi:hypothetical protein
MQQYQRYMSIGSDLPVSKVAMKMGLHVDQVVVETLTTPLKFAGALS